MNLALLYVQLILTALLTGISCCIPGTFLILRGTSLISDAISHAIFLGIVLAFLLCKQFYGPFLFLGATITGLTTIWIIERINSTKRIYPDAVIGIMFPFLFSIAVILINLHAQNIHLDIDAVLLGELAFTPLYQITWNNVNIGSYSLWTMLTITAINIIMLKIFYQKLIIATFDHDYATIIGYNPNRTYWILMTTTCITILGAFESVGAILVVAFMITPPATAYLITKRINHMLLIGILMSVLGTLLGCLLAHLATTSIAGSIATTYGALFAIAFLWQYKVQKKSLICSR
jgi:manganese/zinc/iron transport system permease protein